MTFDGQAALTLAAEAEEDERGFEGRFFYDAERGDIGWIAKACDDKQCDCERKLNADGDQDCSHSLSDWEGEDHICEPIVNMLNRNPQLASMLRAAVARVEDLEAETRAVRMTEADLVRMPMSDLDHHKAELLAMLTDRDSLRAKLAEVEADRDKWRHIAKVQDEKAHTFLEQRDSARRELGRLGDKRREAEHRASLAEAALDSVLAATKVGSSVTSHESSLAEVMRVRYGREARQWQANHDQRKAERDKAEAALGEMTKERDWAVAVQRAALESQERLGTTLAAALQAKDEACDIAERHMPPKEHRWADSKRDETRITELRSVGKEAK
jgi:hypothetical protein